MPHPQKLHVWNFSFIGSMLVNLPTPWSIWDVSFSDPTSLLFWALKRRYRLRLPAATGRPARLGSAGHDQLPHGKYSHADAPAEDAGVARWRLVDVNLGSDGRVKKIIIKMFFQKSV